MSAESQPADKLIGQILADRYQILHRLGEGAMGAVYKARHVKVGRSFAVKVLHARLLQDPKVALRFEREAELAGRLRHPNVVGVVDVGEVEGMRYMVMDFAEGPDLAELLVEAPMPAERIIHLVRQMLEGLYHAHESGLIHRDFKPENVIVERDTHGAEMPRIVDFGIAILRDGGETVDGQGRLTTNGLVLGTPHYMAPEQAVADPIDHRIDLFALGIVIYEMLCGRLPFDGSGAEVARANLLLDPPRIMQRVPYLEVDPLLEAFARRLMAKKRNARPATANAARELLDLIEHDRAAASAALGVPMSDRAPAATQPVAPQHRIDSEPGPPAAQTAQMRPTPPASHPAQPAVELPGTAQSTNLEVLAASPVAYGAPPAAGTQGNLRTLVRTPLSWEAAPVAKRRKSWLIAAVSLGAVGIAAGWIIATTGTDPDPSTPGARIVMTPIGPDPTATVSRSTATEASPTGTQATAPSPPEPTAAETTAPVPAVTTKTDDTAGARSAEPGPTDRNAADRKVRPADPRPTTRPLTHRPSTYASSTTDAKAHDAKAHDARASDTTAEPRAAEPRAAEPRAAEPRPAEPRPAEPRPAEPRAAEPRPAEPRAAEPRPAEPRTITQKPADAKPIDPPAQGGISANALSVLWASVGKELGELPTSKSDDLWSQWRRIKIQDLMAAPQGNRDEAARQLRQIHLEAARRK